MDSSWHPLVFKVTLDIVKGLQVSGVSQFAISATHGGLDCFLLVVGQVLDGITLVR